MRIAWVVALASVLTGLALLVLGLLPAAQLDDVTTSVVLAALLLAWPCASATTGHRRPPARR